MLWDFSLLYNDISPYCSFSTKIPFRRAIEWLSLKVPRAKPPRNPKDLLVSPVWRPWYLIEYALNGLPVNSKDIERHTVKGSGRAVYYVINQTKYAFPNGDTFEGLGFDWNDVWYLTDNDLSVFPAGPDIPGCDAKSCIGSPFFNPYKGSENIPQVIS